MDIVLTRYDGVFFIGQALAFTSRHEIVNPAVVLHIPVQVQSRIAGQSGIAYQTSIVFMECDHFQLPADCTLTILNPEDKLVRHYLAALDIYKKTAPEFSSGEQKH